jgi:uncharacterized SAM-binding protein YcdF (DUF218 family)
MVAVVCPPRYRAPVTVVRDHADVGTNVPAHDRRRGQRPVAHEQEVRVLTDALVTKPRPNRWRRRRTVAMVVALVVLLFVGATARIFVWPELPPLPDHANAIVELGGENDDGRDSVALALARAHKAPLLIQSTRPADALSETCLQPVPGVRILCFTPVPDTTLGEARYIGQLATQLHWTSVIIVTTPDQAWRARLRVSRCFDGSVYVSTAPLPAVDWIRQVPYQWLASVKALTVQRSC